MVISHQPAEWRKSQKRGAQKSVLQWGFIILTLETAAIRQRAIYLEIEGSFNLTARPAIPDIGAARFSHCISQTEDEADGILCRLVSVSGTLNRSNTESGIVELGPDAVHVHWGKKSPDVSGGPNVAPAAKKSWAFRWNRGAPIQAPMIIDARTNLNCELQQGFVAGCSDPSIPTPRLC